MLLDDFQSWRNEVAFILNKKEYNLKKEGEVNISYLIKYPSSEYQLGSVPIYEVSSYHYLVKLIGEFKSHFSDRNVKILFRGQRRSHGFLQLPTLFRYPILNNIVEKLWQKNSNKSSWRVFAEKNVIPNYHVKTDRMLKRVQDLDKSITLFSREKSIWEGVPNMLASEPILQHYGYEGRWLDIVDNLPIAMWFASRSLNDSWSNSGMFDHTTNFGYLLIYGIVAERKITKGIWESNTQRLVNLAEATNPDALRPHIQYAFSLLYKPLLSIDIRSFSSNTEEIGAISQSDYSKFLLCIIKIPSINLFEWTGIKKNLNHYYLPKILTYRTLCPSPSEDNFFKKLYIYERKEENFPKKKIKPYNYSNEEFY